jgi:hypothetical protein
MKIPETMRQLAEIAHGKTNPDEWLKNAWSLHHVWKVEIEEAIKAVDSHWQARDKNLNECLGTQKTFEDLQSLDFFAFVFHRNPSALMQAIIASPEATISINSMGADAIERLGERTNKAQRISKKARNKLPRGWRTMAFLFWTDTIERFLPTPPICLLSDTAICELFTTDSDCPSGESIRQEINRGLNLYRPRAPRYGIERRRDKVRFVLEHSGKQAVTENL